MATLSLRQFCSKYGANNRVFGVDGKKIFTHLDLMGGEFSTLNVPDEHAEEFLKSVALEIERNEKFHLIEHRTDVFPMFYDVDCKFEVKDLPSVATVAKVFREIMYDLRRFFPDVPESDYRVKFRCIVATSPDKQLESGMVKRGYHLHFPNIYVNKEQACMIHASATSMLNRLPPGIRMKLPDGMRYEDILDDSVFHANGLRMIEQDKITVCEACKGKKPAINTCQVCASKGRLSENRPYSIGFTIGGDGTPDNEFTMSLKESVLKTVQVTSIRSFNKPADPLFKRYPGAPSPFPTHEVNNVKNRTTTLTTTYEHANDKDGMNAIAMVKQPIRDPAVFEAIYRVIQKRMPQVYRNVEIREAHYRDRSKKEMYVKLRGEGSNYCQNVKRDHTSNTAFFHISRSGITQRCWSHKHCKRYASDPVSITPQDLQDLFPPTTQREKKARGAMGSVNDESSADWEEMLVSKVIAKFEAQAGYCVKHTDIEQLSRRNSGARKRVKKTIAQP